MGYFTASLGENGHQLAIETLVTSCIPIIISTNGILINKMAAGPASRSCH